MAWGRGGSFNSCDALLGRVEKNDPKLVELVILPMKSFGAKDLERLSNALGKSKKKLSWFMILFVCAISFIYGTIGGNECRCKGRTLLFILCCASTMTTSSISDASFSPVQTSNSSKYTSWFYYAIKKAV